MYAEMMRVPAREFVSLPTNSIGGLSAVALACQGIDWFSTDAFGVHGTCSMSWVLERLAYLSCLQGRLPVYPESGVKPEPWDAYSNRPISITVNTKTGTGHPSPEGRAIPTMLSSMEPRTNKELLVPFLRRMCWQGFRSLPVQLDLE
jgi:hypothetical protein